MMAANNNDGSVSDLFIRGLLHYQHHPILMLPFLIQAAVGIVVTWFDSRMAYAPAGFDGVFLGILLVAGFGNFFLQLWGFRLVAASFDPGWQLWGEFRFALKRWISVIAVTLIATLPVGVLMTIFAQGAEGTIRYIGLILSVTLINWLIYQSYIGVLDARMKAWPAFREAVLLLAASPALMFSLLAVVLAFTLLGSFFSNNIVLVGVAQAEAGGAGIAGSVFWIALNVVFLPLILIWMVMFHRKFRMPPPDIEAGEEVAESA